MIRTIEELEKANFEDLTYGELVTHELDCDEHCPLYGEFCNGGFRMGNNGQYQEPPCINFNEEKRMSEIYSDLLRAHRHQEEYEDRQLKLKEEKEKRSQQRKQKLYEYRTRNYDELQLIRVLKSRIKDYKKSIEKINKAKIYAESVNTVNEMFRQCNTDCPSNIQTDQITLAIEKMNSGISQCQQLIEEAKAKLKQREMENKND